MMTAGVFLAVAVGILVLLQVGTDYARRNRRQVQRRMVREFAPTQGLVANALYKDLGSLDSESGIRPRSAAARPRAASLRERLDALVRQSGLTITVNQLARTAVLGGVCLGAAGGWAAGWVGGVLGGVAGVVTPVLVVSAVRDRRRARLVVQLAAAFDQMARVLRAGQSIIESLRSVVETCDDPLAGEFAPVLHQIDMGLRPDEAFAALGRGTSVLELRLFVLAMAIHRQTGGNLADVLDRLAAMTRARVRLRQKISSLTAEGRLQSLTLVLLPPLTFVVMFVLNRQYAESLLEHARLLAATAGLMGVGVLWTRRIVNFEG